MERRLVAAPPFPDADLMYIVDLLPPEEQSRYQEIRDFLQSRIRAASIDYWNREEFPFGLLAELGKYGLGGLQTDGTSKLFKGLMYVEVARADVSLSALVGIHNELIVGMIDQLGSEGQKARWLPGLTALHADRRLCPDRTGPRLGHRRRAGNHRTAGGR